ncbi:acyltransferase [Chlamydiota bacterium]
MEQKKDVLEIQKELFGKNQSKIKKYTELVVGKPGFVSLLKHELLTTLFAWIPGALGLFLRSKLYPCLFNHVGRNVSFGTNLVLRHPHKITIGDNVVIDDNCLLDAKGSTNKGIVIGSGVFIGRNGILHCKNGDIILKNNVNIGFNCDIASSHYVEIGNNVLLAAYAYVVGGGHAFSRSDIPVLEQKRTAQGIIIGDDVWIGAGVTVLDGVTVGAKAILGTGAVVTGDISQQSIAVGIPAKVVKERE